MKLNLMVTAAALIVSAAPAIADGAREANGAEGVVLTSFSAGLSDPNGIIPAFDGVAGAGVHNWDIATPKALLVSGTSYTYQMTFQSLNYSGNCKASYKLTQKQGTKNVVLDSGVIIKSFDCTSPTNWVFAIPAKNPIPNSPGPATLTGTLTLDGGKITMDVPVIIQ
jgi:hypothetical protein